MLYHFDALFPKTHLAHIFQLHLSALFFPEIRRAHRIVLFPGAPPLREPESEVHRMGSVGFYVKDSHCNG